MISHLAHVEVYDGSDNEARGAYLVRLEYGEDERSDARSDAQTVRGASTFAFTRHPAVEAMTTGHRIRDLSRGDREYRIDSIRETDAELQALCVEA